MELSAEEIRVLGCLIEKQLATPQLYPLTESALITACNQSTNRFPVVTYTQSTVRRALLDLRQQGLAKMLHRPGDRVEKHRHLFDEALELGPADVAVLCVLMLRGPQTVGELRTRTERLHAFSSTAEIEAALEQLAARSPEPLVSRLERRPGQKEARYAQLLGGAEAADEVAALQDSAPPPTARRETVEVAALTAEIADLRSRVARLEQELGIEPRLSPGHHVAGPDLGGDDLTT